MKKILGVIIRILFICFFSLFALFDILVVIFSPFSGLAETIPQYILLLHSILNLLFFGVFLYGIYLVGKNKRNYFKTVFVSTFLYYIYTTLYRFFYITHNTFQYADFTNFLIFTIPVGILAIAFYIEPRVEEAQTLISPLAGPFTPLQYQGFITRGFANIVDQLLVVVPIIIIGIITKADSEQQNTLIAFGGFIFLVYLIVAEARWGQTIGKKLFGIKVMMQDGRECTFAGALFRNIFRCIDIILGGYLVALIVMSITQKRQRVGDLIAKTVVIKP